VRPRSSGWQPQSVSATRSLPTPRLWTAAQAAAWLSVRTSWVYEATRERRLPVVRLGKHCRYLEEDLDAWIAARRIEARTGAHRSSVSRFLSRVREFDRL
jgi:excisionase family DNA binding protein